jgi:uncharacterized protein YcbK (DUF882 family)
MNETSKQRLLARRCVIKAGAALALGAAPLRAMAATAPRHERVLSFHSLHTGESLARPYRLGDAYVPSALAEIDTLLRDFRTDEVRPIDPALLDLLYELRIVLGSDQPYHVISGYRSPKTNAKLAQKSGGVAKKSFHMKGMAIDVRLPHQDLAKVRQAAMDLHLGGVGYYPGSDFVHLDTGRIRFW